VRRTETEYSREGLVMARDYERCLSSMCHHVSNDQFYGMPFLLEPFQRENIWKPIFATGEVRDGRFVRRFRRAVIGLPSGYGKTELAAAIVMTVATMEVIHNGQYGVVASSKDQVRNIFEKISTMIRLNDIWKSQWEVGKDVITNRETGARIMVLPNKPDALESWHFNVLIFDELHVYRDSRTWDAGVKGQKVLFNPLTIGITTAADSREGFLWELLQKADQDNGMYVYWLGLDDDADLSKRADWEPLMVASWVTWESIQDQRNMAATKRAFERYTANRFPKSKNADSCFTARELDRCDRGKNDFDFDEPYTIGIDGATSGDSFAIVAYQERKRGKKTVALTKEWVFDEPDEDTGHYPLNQIMELIAGICDAHWPEVVGLDPNRLLVMSSQLKDVYGIETVAFAQNNATMCQACSIVANEVHSGSLRTHGCRKLRQHLANTVELDREPYGMRFGKDSKKSKIDAAIALSIAALAYDKLVAGTEGMVPVG
jgi:phage terminase large subunit-like protein